MKELLSRAPLMGEEAPVTPGQMTACRALGQTGSFQSLGGSCLPEIRVVAVPFHSPAALMKELLRPGSELISGTSVVTEDHVRTEIWLATIVSV